MVDVKNEIIIDLPKEIVAEFVSNPGNAPQWCTHIKSVEWDKEKPLRAGARIVFNEQVMHRYQQHVYEVVEIIPSQKMVIRTRSNGMMLETTFGWQAVNENTTCMTLQNRGIPAFSKALSPLFALTIRTFTRRNLKYLKRMLENSNRRLAVL
jgi:hypothetical protein